MNARTKHLLSNSLTIVYLLSAFVVTAATSKSGEGGKGYTLDLNGITNYAVQSTCAPDVAGIRTDSTRITQTLSQLGVVDAATKITFLDLAFPGKSALLGFDQIANETTNSRTCKIRAKSVAVNPRYDEKDTKAHFIEPGSLTTLTYDCYYNDTYVCTNILSEQPMGDLSSALLR